MRSLRLALPASLLALTAVAAGCGDGADDGASDPADTPAATGSSAPAEAGEPPADCPTPTTSEDGVTDYIVGFREGSAPADDEAARADVLAEVGERICQPVTEVRRLAPGVVLVRVAEPLAAADGTTLIKALTSRDDVLYAEPDQQMSIPEPPSAT